MSGDKGIFESSDELPRNMLHTTVSYLKELQSKKCSIASKRSPTKAFKTKIIISAEKSIERSYR